MLTSALGRIENLQCRGVGRERSPEDYSPEFQICLPYGGFFVWHVGYDDVVADANQVLFVSAGESFGLSEPRAGGFAELIVTPDVDLLSELVGTTTARLSTHPLFVRRSRRATSTVQYLCARTLHTAASDDVDPLERDELLLAVLRHALDGAVPTPPSSERTSRLIARTKALLEAHFMSPVRLSEVARAVNASPAYLTDVFRRHEGVALHRYLVQLRLARALVELPYASDLTTLALDLGFSSHSHFASAFRRAFRCTPSAFRTCTRRESASPRSSQRVLAK